MDDLVLRIQVKNVNGKTHRERMHAMTGGNPKTASSGEIVPGCTNEAAQSRPVGEGGAEPCAEIRLTGKI